MESHNVLTRTKWTIDHLHSEVGFKIKHLMFTNVRGHFTEYDGNIYTMGYDFLTADIDFWINPLSITTYQSMRDAHLKNEDFFDTQHFNKITFKAQSYEKAEKGGNYFVIGDLTIKGISKKIKLFVEFNGIVKDPWGLEKIVFNVKGNINRTDWGLSWNIPLEAGGLMIGEQVSINVELQLSKEVQH